MKLVESEVRRMPIEEFREHGFLQEANRLFFHPLGLALEVVIEDNGEERLGGIWDYRDDPEGMAFGNNPDWDKMVRVEELRGSKLNARQKSFGYFIQPVSKD